MKDFEYVIEGNALKTSVTSSLDNVKLHSMVEKFCTKEIIEVLEKNKDIERLVLDMRNCSYVHSKALAELISLKRNVSKFGVNISLSNVPEHVVMMLEVTNLVGLFDLIEDYSAYTVTELCSKFLDPDEAPKVSEYLSKNYNEEIRAKLVKLLYSGMSSDTICEYTVYTIGRAYDYDSVEVIRSQLNSQFANVQAAAIAVLGWLGDRESKERLYEFLDICTDARAQAAAAAIALLADETDPERMLKYLNADEAHRVLAVHALTVMGFDEAYEMIINHLAIENSEGVRKAIANRLSMFNRQKSIDILISMLEDKSVAVKEAAAISIAKLGAGGHVDELLEKACDKDTLIAYFAVKALARSKDKVIVDRLMELYPTLDESVKLSVIEVVSAWPELSAEFFKKLLDDNNEDIRKEALQGLYKSSEEDALTYALELIDKDPSWLVRYHAVDIVVSCKPEGYQDILKGKLEQEESRYVRDKITANIED